MEKVINVDKLCSLYEDYVILAGLTDNINFGLDGTVTCVLGNTTRTIDGLEISQEGYHTFIGDWVALYCGYEDLESVPEDNLWLLSVADALCMSAPLGQIVDVVSEYEQRMAYLFDSPIGPAGDIDLTIVTHPDTNNSVYITFEDTTYEARSLEETHEILRKYLCSTSHEFTCLSC